MLLLICTQSRFCGIFMATNIIVYDENDRKLPRFAGNTCVMRQRECLCALCSVAILPFAGITSIGRGQLCLHSTVMIAPFLFEDNIKLIEKLIKFFRLLILKLLVNLCNVLSTCELSKNIIIAICDIFLSTDILIDTNSKRIYNILFLLKKNFLTMCL